MSSSSEEQKPTVDHSLADDPKFKATLTGERWVMTIDAGVRFLGRVQQVDPERRTFTLQPALEYLTQIKFVRGGPPQRDEAVVAVDMVGDVPVRIKPMAFLWIDELPAWRQRELRALIDEGMKQAEKLATTKRSGLILPGA
jgi:hypothetical protein